MSSRDLRVPIPGRLEHPADCTCDGVTTRPRDLAAARRGNADHEAGHVLLAAIVGYPIIRAWSDAVPAPGHHWPNGQALFWQWRFGRRPTSAQVECLVQMAGPEAEWRGPGEHIRRDVLLHLDALVAQDKHWTHQPAVDERYTQATIWWQDARHLVKQHWTAVERVSAALLDAEGHPLPGDTLCTLLLEALPWWRGTIEAYKGATGATGYWIRCLPGTPCVHLPTSRVEDCRGRLAGAAA